MCALCARMRGTPWGKTSMHRPMIHGVNTNAALTQ
jgi:hypothetical protein